ncbi:hypothetical protein F4678DRAFT_107951 [Xylaria arbuscula]|nr:hypothetical protein F4678DRAFT_107951 [Xylaria arbuscula]
MTTQDVSNQDGLDDIPPLITIAPSIFVPTDRDFTKTPPPLSDDPTARLETTIDALDWHAAHVEKNMILMLAREAERVRLAEQVESVQNNSSGRTVKDQHWRTDNELHIEETILREDQDLVVKILRDARYKDNEDVGSSREGPRSKHRPYSPPPFSTRSRGSIEPEYADLATLRHEKMFRTEVDERRQTPRSKALTHVLNLVKWGWDDQLEGHRAVVQKEKDERRENLRRHMKENPFLFDGMRQTSAPSASAPLPPGLMHGNSGDGDLMDIDQ